MKAKLLLCVGLLVGTCNLYGMGAGDGKPDAPATETKKPTGAAAAPPAAKEEDRRSLDFSENLEREVSKLLKNNIHTPELAKLLHEAARDANRDVFYSLAASDYWNGKLRYSACNLDGKTLLESARQAPDSQKKQVIIGYILALQIYEKRLQKLERKARALGVTVRELFIAEGKAKTIWDEFRINSLNSSDDDLDGDLGLAKLGIEDSGAQD